jgi:phosphoribosylcarboxyaminoimidazole (NCAIR) mutase
MSRRRLARVPDRMVCWFHGPRNARISLAGGGSSDLPGSSASHAVAPLFGLAPDGVYRAVREVVVQAGG